MRSFIVFFLQLICFSLFGQLTLPKVLSDGMVLQREKPIKIWGWAGPGEQVEVEFLKEKYQTRADGEGNWLVTMKPQIAGGPYAITVKAEKTIRLEDVMIGDIWLCSGQSNMEFPVRRAAWVYPQEIANARNEMIRQFYVPREYDFNVPRKDVAEGSWISADPSTVLDFSAVAYFFALEIYEKYKIPVGLINASLGGSPAQAWISEEAIKTFPKYYDEAQQFKDSAFVANVIRSDEKRIGAWHEELNRKDLGYQEVVPWSSPILKTRDWKRIQIPGFWADGEPGAVNGVMWFRRSFQISSGSAADGGLLILGRIVDADSVFINGRFVGNTTYQYPPRRYQVPGELLNRGENTIVVRVVNESGRGGFWPDKDYQLVLSDDTIDLKGEWKYCLGAEMPPLAGPTFVRWKPVGLYNAMINPFTRYPIKGAIWYQGESNAGNPSDYRQLMATLIGDWRNRWGQADMPFLFVQLANFMEPRDQPTDSHWARLREQQLLTLNVPNTGMAVAIDIGEWNDVHPLNKKEVGRRLALQARKIAYSETSLVASGPIFDSMKIRGKKIILSFKETGSGLISSDGRPLRHFAIAGEDKKFVWARAKVQGDKAVVWSPDIRKPVAVRYAWADNPEGANLVNKEGLPASPFRTDE